MKKRNETLEDIKDERNGSTYGVKRKNMEDMKENMEGK